LLAKPGAPEAPMKPLPDANASFEAQVASNLRHAASFGTGGCIAMRIPS